MSEEMRTAEKFMQAVNAMKNALDTEGLEKDLDLELAARHNLRRKLRMTKSMQELYRFLHGNGPKPKMLPSEEFNPFEGIDKANIHYLIKAMSAVPPWELRKDVLVAPTAVTLLMVEVASKLFPGPPVFRFRLLVEEFINRWTMPKFRREWDDAELEEQVTRYKTDMLAFENRFKERYAELSVYFGSLEDPAKNPVEKKIGETHKNAKAVAEKVCGKEPNASFVAQEKAYKLWLEYRDNLEVKAKYCTKDHHISYADVFDYCKKQIRELGFKSAKSFEKACKANAKRNSRLGKETRKSKKIR